MTDTNFWLILATYVGPTLVSVAGIAFTYLKTKADVTKTYTDSGAVSGEIFLKWTQEFKDRLKVMEAANDRLIEKGVAQDCIISSLKEDLAKQERIVDKQSTALLVAEGRISSLEQDNIKLLEKIEGLETENTTLRARVADLEKENASLKGK